MTGCDRAEICDFDFRTWGNDRAVLWTWERMVEKTRLVWSCCAAVPQVPTTVEIVRVRVSE